MMISVFRADDVEEALALIMSNSDYRDDPYESCKELVQKQFLKLLEELLEACNNIKEFTQQLEELGLRLDFMSGLEECKFQEIKKNNSFQHGGFHLPDPNSPSLVVTIHIH